MKTFSLKMHVKHCQQKNVGEVLDYRWDYVNLVPRLLYAPTSLVLPTDLTPMQKRGEMGTKLKPFKSSNKIPTTFKINSIIAEYIQEENARFETWTATLPTFRFSAT